MFAEIELARRLEQAEGCAGASFVEARGGASCWIRIAGAYAMFDGAESPLTQTFGLGMFEPATPSALTEAEQFFKSRGAPVQHEVSPLAGIPLMRSLSDRGYVPFEISNVLYLDLAQRQCAPAPASGFTMRVAAPADSEAYNRAASEGWREAAELVELIAELARVMFQARGYTGFVVEKGGHIIATAGLCSHGKVALFAGASTVPEYRGQGAQRAVLERRLEYASESGCDVAMIVTEPGSASQRNAERAGFRIAYTRTKWQLR